MENALKRWSIAGATFATLLALSPQGVAAESRSTSSINYNYLYADVSSGSSNEDLGVNSNVTAVASVVACSTKTIGCW